MTTAQPSKPGTYAAKERPGSIPEAYLAFPFTTGDEAAYRAATLFAAALDDGKRGADGALLDKALAGLAREFSVRVLGWPRAPALVIRVVAAQASLDTAVMQTRALVDRLHSNGLAPADFERSTTARARSALVASLDPRARVVGVWRGETTNAPPRVSADDARAFAQKYLAEDSMLVVVSRPGRPGGP
jgi:hypothetical protein